jgi:bacillaene synthase trans-acting acyltransferase
LKNENTNLNNTSNNTILPKKRKIIFMYSGQGSHYYNMGFELYQKNEIFRKTMERCNQITSHKYNINFLDVLYDSSKKFEIFDNILYSHPAIFSIGYSLTQIMYENNIKPDCVLGYSLGEFTSLVVSNILSLEEGLDLIMNQAKLLHETRHYGGILVVLEDISFFDNNEILFKGSTFAGLNYEKCFLISGPNDILKQINTNLNKNSIISQFLPVKYAFHSEYIDGIKENFMEFLKTFSFKKPDIPVFSSSLADQLSDISIQYLWDIIRKKIQFNKLISNMQRKEDFIYIDLGPTGTLVNFIKYGFNSKISSYSVMNPFNENIKTLNLLLANLDKLGIYK